MNFDKESKSDLLLLLLGWGGGKRGGGGGGGAQGQGIKEREEWGRQSNNSHE